MDGEEEVLLSKNTTESIDTEEIPEFDEEEFSKASRKGAFFNISNCAVGAGILSLPYAFETMGLCQALVIFVIFGFITCITLQMLPLCAEALGVKSYEGLMEACFGKITVKIFQVIVILYSFGVITGYIVIVGDLLPPIISQWAGVSYPNDHWYFNRNFYQVTITVLVLIPLSSLKRLDSLKFASMFAITSVIYFTILVVVETGIDFDDYQERGQIAGTDETIAQSIVWWNWSTDIFLGIPIMAFAFGGHLQSISIYVELQKKHRTLKNWNFIAIAAVLFLSTIYLLVGALSYLRFLPGEDGNVLEQMLSDEPENVAIQLAALAMTMVVILSFPLFVWPTRFALDRLVFPMLISFYDPKPEAKGWKVQLRFYLITIGIVGSSLLVASLVGSLEVVFGLTGATGGALIKFIFPAMCYWKAGPIYREKKGKTKSLPNWEKLTLLFVITASAMVGIISSCTVIWDSYQNWKED